MLTTERSFFPPCFSVPGCCAATPQDRAGEVGYACSMNMLGGGIEIR